MKKDLGAVIDRIAHFMDIPCNDKLKELIKHRSSLQYMRANQHLLKIFR